MLRSPITLLAAVVVATVSLLPEASGRAAGPAITLTTLSDHTVYLPLGGMRDTGAFLQSAISPTTTTLLASDASTLRPGQKIEVLDGAQTEGMAVTTIASDGVLGTTDFINVTRGQFGTAAANHGIGKKLYADFTRADVMIAGVAERNSGVTLTQPIDGAAGESSPAVLAAPTDDSQTVAQVSDASVVAGAYSGGVMDPVAASIDGMYGTGATNLYNGFLSSAGASMTCDGDQGTPAYVITVRCSTLASTLGPSGSGRLGTVNLIAPHLPGIVNLTLSDVILSPVQPPDPFGGGDPPIPVQETIGGNVAVGSPPPLAPSVPAPTAGLTSVWLSPGNVLSLPSTDATPQVVTVDVWVQNVPEPDPVLGGHGLGGFQFSLSWDRPAEDVTVTDARSGYIDDSGQPWARGVNLSSNVSAAASSLPVSNASSIQPGWTARVDGEQLLVTSVGASSISVLRGYRGTAAVAHNSGADVYAGPERVTLVRSATPSPHPAGALIQANTRVLSVSNHSALTAYSSITIDSERFKLVQRPAWGLNPAGGSLTGGLTDVQTSSSVTGAAVTSGSVVLVDAEWMAVTALSGSTATFRRGLWGSTPTAHNPGATIAVLATLPNKLRVTRSAFGSTAASHAAGTPIFDDDGLGAFTTTASGPNDGTYVVRGVYLGNMLSSTGRSATCPTAATGPNTANIACSSAGPTLGPQGSGALAWIELSGLVGQPSGPAKSIALSGSAADVTGDDLGATSVNGAVRIVKCPDVNVDGVANFPGDVINLAKASFGIAVAPPVNLAKYDINSDGVVNFPGDTLTAAKVVTLGQPSGLRCLP